LAYSIGFFVGVKKFSRKDTSSQAAASSWLMNSLPCLLVLDPQLVRDLPPRSHIDLALHDRQACHGGLHALKEPEARRGLASHMNPG